jgi:hypothetical protein
VVDEAELSYSYLKSRDIEDVCMYPLSFLPTSVERFELQYSEMPRHRALLENSETFIQIYSTQRNITEYLGCYIN